MSTDTREIVVLDADDSVDSGSKQESAAKPSHRKGKQYHDFFFTNSSSTIKAKPGVQSRPEIKAYCKLCITKKNPNGKELNATDTFTAFKIHVENKHKRKQCDGDDNVK